MNASEAKEQANKYNNQKLAEQYDDILNCISEKSGIGGYKLKYFDEITDDNLKKLTELGYTVKKSNSKTPFTYSTISWN